ncbi:hypothetical protein HJC23_002668 [Cyclotella cryptica]|uniref:Disease resistance R13L4/SHOC-2-like LRR domain-containing protein n=1 Tax=Cyclotella cryptica TaxID=29204 RepID=A0ABD3P1J6_9STRA
MTKPSSNTNRHDADSNDASVPNTAANGGKHLTLVRYQTVLDQLNKAPKFTDEWFRLKEEERQLRSQHDFPLMIDSSNVVNAGEFGDVSVEKSHNENFIKLEDNRHEIPHDSRSSPSVGKSSNEDGHTPSIIAGDFSPPSCTGSTANKPDPPNSKERQGRVPRKMHLKPLPATVRSCATKSHSHHDNEGQNVMENTGHHMPPATNVPSHCNVVDNFEPFHSNSITEAPIHILEVTCDEPRRLDSNTFQDAKKSKEKTSIETQLILDDECPLPQIVINLADSVITEKPSGIDAAIHIKSEHYACSVGQHLSEAEADDRSDDEGLLNNEGLHPRTMIPELNMNYGLQLSHPSIPPASNRSQEHSNVLSGLARITSVHGKEEEEESVIPEAVLVDEDVPMQVTVVGIADWVEPDHTVPFNKKHACLIFIFFGVIAIVLGVTLNTARDTPSVAITGTASSLSPAAQPSFALPPTYSSFESLRSAIEKNVLQRNVTFDRMESSNARVLALDWITDKDNVKADPRASNIFQRYILALLAFEFSSQRLLSDPNECMWSGVSCDEYGHVTKLEFNGYSLDGTMPPEIGSLPFLEVLSLTDNILHGTLPSEIGYLRKLTALNLNNNEFTGSLPTELGYLTLLTVFSINGNQFTGRINLEFGLLPSLTQFYVGGNKFTGTIPSELGLFKSLTILSFDGNQFIGTLPSELGLLTSLTSLSVAENLFSGTLPSELSLLASLTYLSVSSNQFAGTIPTELGLLTSLTQLRVYDNGFTGTLPSQLGLLKSLWGIGVDYNQFTGTLLSELGFLTSLSHLTVNDNQFTGTVPSELGNLTSLTYLDISKNQFTGTFPSQMKRYLELSELSLSNNNFVGTLPSWIGDLKDMTSLRLNHNNFNGTLPPELGNLISLTSLGISHNEFSGTFPAWIGSLENLSWLWLEDNQFTGSFPSEVQQNLDLKHICLFNNNFTSLPEGIENYSPYFCS